jgi:glycerophosphoryl diester phosphodiesterase
MSVSVVPAALPIVVAHRGNSGEMPENTLVAYEAAIRIGADIIEVDIRTTRDGHVVLIHDETVDRTTNGQGRVASMSLEEVRALDAGVGAGSRFRGERVPTLAEALELARGRAMLNLDLYTPDAIRPMVALLRDARMVREVVVTGCTEWWARLVHDEAPSLPVFLNVDETLEEMARRSPSRFESAGMERALRAGLRGLNWEHTYLTPELVRRARMRGLAVWTWTVDDPARMAEVVGWGVDALTTNHPARLVRLLGRGPDARDAQGSWEHRDG